MSDAVHMSTKRGPSDLNTQSSMAMVNNSSINANDAKKAKLDNGPSRVVHIRNIPSLVNEAEIIQLGIPFGTVTNVLVLKGKNQAFLEMSDLATASRMVEYFSTTPAQIRSNVVYVQFSNHQELKTNQTHSNANPSAQAAIQAVGMMSSDGSGGDGQGPNTVLRVLIENMVYPVTLDVLHEIFSRVGRVLRIVTFTKMGSFQALIQYSDVVTAQAAKMQLDCQNIYNQCCTLRIQYSRLSNLNIKYNNDKSRDYTNPDLPPGNMNDPSSLLGNVPPALQSAISGLLSGGGGGANPGAMGDAGSGMRQGPPVPGTNGNSTSNAFMQQATAIMDAINSGQQLQMPSQRPGCVLLVSNLDPQNVTPDDLFTLFGAYGDVMRVKILFNKKDNALIQMREPEHASLAQVHLNDATLWGRQLRIAPSHFQNIQMPRADMQDEGLNRDYSDSSDHRYRRFTGSSPLQHIYRPTSTLHLSSVAQGTSEETIRQHFADAGFTVDAFKFITKRDATGQNPQVPANGGATRSESSMALIQLASVEEAILGLMRLHLKELNGSRVRISFTKSTI